MPYDSEKVAQRAYTLGVEDALSTTELYEIKLAGSGLRRRLSVVAEPFTKHERGLQRYNLQLGDKNIGFLTTRRSSDPRVPMIDYAKIAPEFRGLGLSKKLYGEVMRRLPGGEFLSGGSVTPAAMRTWESMLRNPSYAVDVSKRLKRVAAPGGKDFYTHDIEFMNKLHGDLLTGVSRSRPRDELFRGKITEKALIK